MTNRLMISVAAAALIAGTGLAGAQQPGGGRDAPSGSTVQQSAPSSERAAPSAAPTNRDSATDSKGSDGMKATQSEPKGMSKDSPKSAQSTDSMSKDSSKNAQSKDGMSKDSPKNAQSTDSMSKDSSKNAQSRDGATSKDGVKDAQSKDGMSKDSTAAKDGKSSTTTGNAATSATAAPPAEKRTQIVSAIRSEKISETTNVNFNISVGTRVPASVHFYPLPPRIVEIYPEWRGYEVILVSGRYVIIRPQTREIVYVIEG
jgi:hypothetical protein